MSKEDDIGIKVFPDSTNHRRNHCEHFYISLKNVPHTKCIKYILTELLYIL